MSWLRALTVDARHESTHREPLCAEAKQFIRDSVAQARRHGLEAGVRVINELAEQYDRRAFDIRRIARWT